MLKLINTTVILLLLASANFAQSPFWILMDNDVASFSPLDLGSKLVAWYEGDIGLTTDTWADQSGNNRDMTLTNSPTINLAALNGHNTLKFNGTDQRGQTTAFTLDQPTIVYIVFRVTNWGDGQAIFDGYNNLGGMFAQHDIAPTLYLYAGIGYVTWTQDLALNTFGVVRVIFNGASSEIRVNDNTASTGNPGTASMGGFTLASRGSAGNYTDPEVAEIILLNNSPSAEEDIEIMNYLNTKYAIY